MIPNCSEVLVAMPSIVYVLPLPVNQKMHCLYNGDERGDSNGSSEHFLTGLAVCENADVVAVQCWLDEWRYWIEDVGLYWHWREHLIEWEIVFHLFLAHFDTSCESKMTINYYQSLWNKEETKVRLTDFQRCVIVILPGACIAICFHIEWRPYTTEYPNIATQIHDGVV